MSTTGIECKIRSPEVEAALDARIAVIRRRNKAIEERIKIITADKASALGIPVEELVTKEFLIEDEKKEEIVKDNNKKNSNKNPLDSKWNREWDAGKTKTEEWITNVPPIDDTTCFISRQKDIEHGKKINKKSNHKNNHGSLNNNNTNTSTTSDGKKEGEEKSSGSSKENSNRVNNKKPSVNRSKNNHSGSNGSTKETNGKGLEIGHKNNINNNNNHLPAAFSGPLASRLSIITPNENKKIGMSNHHRYYNNNKDNKTRKHQK